jgi:hypothetical protein
VSDARFKQIGHVFTSYARADKEKLEFCRRQSDLLRRVLWVDQSGIGSDAPNWRSSVEQALQNACAVFVLCSPSARQSENVTAELELARALRKSVYAIWFEGDEWALSAPFSTLPANYTDLRGELWKKLLGLEELANSVVDRWPLAARQPKGSVSDAIVSGFVCSVQNNSGDDIFIRPTSDFSIAELLQSVYELLDDPTLPPLTYGSRWCLIQEGSLLVLPAVWAAAPFEPVHLLQTRWLNYRCSDLGIRSGAKLTLVRDHQFEASASKPIGLFTRGSIHGFGGRFSGKMPFATEFSRALSSEQVSELERENDPQTVLNISDAIAYVENFGGGNRARANRAGRAPTDVRTLTVGQVYQLAHFPIERR